MCPNLLCDKVGKESIKCHDMHSREEGCDVAVRELKWGFIPSPQPGGPTRSDSIYSESTSDTLRNYARSYHFLTSYFKDGTKKWSHSVRCFRSVAVAAAFFAPLLGFDSILQPTTGNNNRD